MICIKENNIKIKQNNINITVNIIKKRKVKLKYPLNTSNYYIWCNELYNKHKDNKCDYYLLESNNNKKLFIVKEKYLYKNNYYYNTIYTVWDLIKDRYDCYLDYKTAYNIYNKLYNNI